MNRRDQMTAARAASQSTPTPLTPLTNDDVASLPAVRPPEAETGLAAQVQDLSASGDQDGARELFSQIVARQQRRASRIAWHYLRDAAEADEAVQDAFVKAYTHIASFQRNLSFEVWFTRILINGCLDRQKARMRRSRWVMPVGDSTAHDQHVVEHASRLTDQSPEDLVLAQEWRKQLGVAVRKLPGRQRLVFLLCHYADHSTRDVAEMTGLNESTVRVHLFRAIRKLRTAMEGQSHAH
jgi:RNA polymerase sigma-70 factor, ECF subfamily